MDSHMWKISHNSDVWPGTIKPATSRHRFATPTVHNQLARHVQYSARAMAESSLQALITSQAIASPQSLALVLLLFLVAVVYLATPRSRAEKLLRKLPSPPLKLPIVGHLHLIGSLPHRSLCDLARKHGPDVLLLRLGAVPTLVVSSPRAARAVLRTHDHHFASRPFSAVADILFNGHTDVAFAPYGDYWRQTRKVVTTHLLTPKKVRASRAAREQEVRLVLDRVRRAATAAAAAAEAVDLSEVFSFFANDIVCQAVVGRFPREQGRNEMFREMLETNAKLLGGFNLEDYFPSLGRLSLVTAKALKHKKKWDEFLDNLIDNHASVKVEDGQEEDFIDVLLSVQEEYSLTRDNIKAILMDMFEAGTDTTYIALDYAMAELMRKPEAMAKLQAEVRSCTGKGKEMVTEEDLSKMTYIKAVMKESMRLHAPGPLLIPHFCTDDCDVEGYTIPAGTRVLLNVWSLGRDPTCWENAEEFIPERFMKQGTDADADFQGNDFRFLPFGSGRRICPAINFTTATFEIILSNLIYHFNWELPPGSTDIDMTESFGMDVHRKENLLLIPSLAS